MSYRIDHYFSLDADGEIEEGRIFCTPEEAAKIKEILEIELPDVEISIEESGEYDYTTEDGTTPAAIAADILANSGFIFDPEE